MMYHFYTDDGRILTPPKELEPQLKGAFTAFSKLLGYIRWFYMADEIWDGKSSLVFKADGDQLATVTLDDDGFYVNIANENFRITDKTLLEDVFDVLKKSAPIRFHRPIDQLMVNPNPNGYICGYRCDLCLGYQSYKGIQITGSDNFVYMDWICYNNCIPERRERPSTSEKGKGIFHCSGCNLDRNKFCRGYTCSKEKGYANCTECGEYHSCDVYRDSHHAGQCNLGITAEEITKLVIPYCMKERLDTFRNSK
ncbi:MAG: hypothetical protein FWF15_06755 [Oscillospiraceae bacterium]|nr:hypothetical protein [Oscillospiraceae bacterium]